ncbi:MAG: sugar ABC transporter permease [Alphaproteobacteria bacterium]|nr:sugar ABC transporter permease [Alphaproteobacteria bacterium]
MSTQHTQTIGRVAVAPTILVLFLWMIVPLGMTIWFSLQRFNLLEPDAVRFIGTLNYHYFLSDPVFWRGLFNSLLIVFWVLVISTAGGIGLALLLDQPIFGVGILRLLVIAPFFIMPSVTALVWKNLLMNPISGVFAFLSKSLGLPPIDWFAHYPMTAIIMMVAWQWLPFATLILLTALQSLNEEIREAAMMDNARPLPYFFGIILPHLARPLTVVILIESIFLLNVFAEIYVTGTGGTAGNLPYLVYFQGLLNFDVGGASAGGIVAVVLANLVAIVLMRMISKNLEQ